MNGRTAAIGLGLALAVVCTSVPAQAKTPVVRPTGMHGLGNATRVIVVATTHTRSTHATVRTFQRRDGRWTIVRGAMNARVGRNGLSFPKHRHGGDGTTPIGNYGFVYGFGSRPDPGMKGFAWRRLRPSSCWSGIRPAYNRWVSRSPCAAGDEALWPSGTGAYRYAAVIDFNYHRPVFGRGSGIFLHVRRHAPTAGCVSLNEQDLLKVLRWVSPHTRILIGTTAWLRGRKHR